MNNYEYIIASLPVLAPDDREGPDFDSAVGQISDLLSEKDRAQLDLLLKGFDDDTLGEDFYKEALQSRCRFIKEYFNFDLAVRDAKVRYLNRALGRPAGEDIFMEAEGEIEEMPRVELILSREDILQREKDLDNLMWEKIDTITTFDYFDLDAVLAFVTKLRIISRWMVLDEENGRAMFRKLVSEVRGTFGGVRFNDK